VGRGVFLAGQRRPYRKRAGPKRSPLWGSLLFMHTPFDAKPPNLTHMGRVLSGQSRPTPRLRGRSTPQFCEFLSVYAIHPLTQNYQISRGNIYREWGLVCRWSATPIPRGRDFSAPQFWGSFLFMCMLPLSQKYQICRGNNMGKGLVFRGQPRPHLKGWGPSAPQFSGFPLFMRIQFVTELANLTW